MRRYCYLIAFAFAFALTLIPGPAPAFAHKTAENVSAGAQNMPDAHKTAENVSAGAQNVPDAHKSARNVSADAENVPDAHKTAENVSAGALGASQTLPTAVPLSGTTVHGPEHGHLIIIGGGVVPADIWDCFCSLAGGPKAHIVVITNASGPKGAYKGPAFDEIGSRVAHVTEMHLEDIAEANDPALVAPLEEADGLFFTGGRQWRIAEVYLNTRAHAAMKALLERGGVIGGTSAGASIQGSFLWRGDTQGADILVGDHTHGLGFMKRTAIDQHLFVRGREQDLLPFIQAAPAYLGIGIDESTAVHVAGDSLRVLGRSKVALYVPGQESFRLLEAGECCDLREPLLSGAFGSGTGAFSPADAESGLAGSGAGAVSPAGAESGLAGSGTGVVSPADAENWAFGSGAGAFSPADAESGLAGSGMGVVSPAGAESGAFGSKMAVVSPAAAVLPDAVSGVAAVKPGEAFRWQQLIAPGVLLTAGTIGTYNSWYSEHVNIPVRDQMRAWTGGRQLHFDDYLQYVPAAAHLGLGFAVPSEHDFLERFCIAATAHAAMGIMTNGLKYTIREQRPDSESLNSFPSGHTSMAFTGAELVRREYGGWWGVGAYALATTTALMRVYNGRHWTSDLLGGAAIGILSADIGYWLMPLERRLFRLDSRKSRQNGGSVSRLDSRSSSRLDGRRSARLDGRSTPASLAIVPTPYGLSVACVF